MPGRAEHRVEMFKLASARRAAGMPSWAETIDVSPFFHDESKPFTERRDLIVAAVKRSKWYTAKPEDDYELREIIEGIEQSDDADEFDGYWEDLYGIADYDRIWIKTF